MQQPRWQIAVSTKDEEFVKRVHALKQSGFSYSDMLIAGVDALEGKIKTNSPTEN